MSFDFVAAFLFVSSMSKGHSNDQVCDTISYIHLYAPFCVFVLCRVCRHLDNQWARSSWFNGLTDQIRDDLFDESGSAKEGSSIEEYQDLDVDHNDHDNQDDRDDEHHNQYEEDANEHADDNFDPFRTDHNDNEPQRRDSLVVTVFDPDLPTPSADPDPSESAPPTAGGDGISDNPILNELVEIMITRFGKLVLCLVSML